MASNSLTIAGLLISGFGGGLKSGNQTILDTFGGSSQVVYLKDLREKKDKIIKALRCILWQKWLLSFGLCSAAAGQIITTFASAQKPEVNLLKGVITYVVILILMVWFLDLIIVWWKAEKIWKSLETGESKPNMSLIFGKLRIKKKSK